MTQEIEAPSQEVPSEVAGSQGADQAGAETPQPDQQPDETPSGRQPGVEQESKPARTAEEAEVEITRLETAAATRDTAFEQLREQTARDALVRQTEKQQATERDAQAVDAKAVDAGDMTHVEAVDASNERRAKAERTVQEAAQGDVVIEQLMDAGSYGVRARAAVKLSKEHGVDLLALLDESIPDERAMAEKAKDLQAEAKEADRKGDDEFDLGQTGTGAPANLDDMSTAEIVALAYSPEETSRRNREKTRRR